MSLSQYRNPTLAEKIDAQAEAMRKDAEEVSKKVEVIKNKKK